MLFHVACVIVIVSITLNYIYKKIGLKRANYVIMMLNYLIIT